MDTETRIGLSIVGLMVCAILSILFFDLQAKVSCREKMISAHYPAAEIKTVCQ